MMAGRTLLTLRLHHPLCPRGAGIMVDIATGAVVIRVIRLRPSAPRALITNSEL